MEYSALNLYFIQLACRDGTVVIALASQCGPASNSEMVLVLTRSVFLWVF